MSYFNIRVELHDANQNDYRTLASEMGRRGMVDVIQGSDNIRYRLPPGEYCLASSSTINQVRDLACAAARTTGKSFAVRVTEGLSTWNGLPAV